MEENDSQLTKIKFPPAIQFLNFHSPVPQPSSSNSTTVSEHFIEDIELDLSHDYESMSRSSSFQHDIASYPWSLFHNVSLKNEYITSDIRPRAIRASVAFSIAPASLISVFCLGASREFYYDATLVFTFSDGERKMYRINASTPLLITNVFNYNMSHKHIILTNNEIDTEPLYAQHLQIMNSFRLVSWSSVYNPSKLLCGDALPDDGMIKKEIQIQHECEYIVHLLNHFIPEKSRITPHYVRSPSALYTCLLTTYRKMHCPE
jgi:hypothetical protein